MSEYQELIPKRIYIGGADAIPELLKKEKIDVVYDLRAENAEGDYDYNRKHQPIVDNAENQDESVKQAIDEVINAYESGKNVYFHCSGGKNRTGTVAIGTLLKLGEANSIEEAEAKAKGIRSVINVNPEMKAALGRLFPGA
ncbi:dual specificity protein phosphatase family protein [Bacillus sp. ISL-37]|jgi:protein-tyrosine phosphatase|uniref:protein-tyrosine phosphatase family protein n=1 Tax=Bacillus sp. ISL-37 TaxID=2819123 RepID=UPI001BECCB62|nr:dual specificity protein phosphatase family protein [Bacillus sp. ISL-37]MBT2684081.1 dual specificity protein phosphatase family protein [Bacillus sp. ISL-37]